MLSLATWEIKLATARLIPQSALWKIRSAYFRVIFKGIKGLLEDWHITGVMPACSERVTCMVEACIIWHQGVLH